MGFVYKSIFAERRYMSYSIKRRTSDDIIVKEFWRNNERFADLFNAVLFKGKCVIKAENLQEIDTDVSGTIRVQEYKETLKRARDVVKKYYNGVEFNILGLEMQEKVHLAMPLRTMVYDALGYIKEYNEFKSNNTKNSIKKKRKVYTDDKDKANNKTNTEYKSANKAESYRTREEFLSGLNYSDKFHPIITIVFYYGEQRWNGPMSLSDMMVDMPDEVKEMFNDYCINLVQIGDTADYDFSNDEVKALFDITNSIYNKDFNAISRNYSEKSLSVELIDMISEMTGTKELARLVNEEKEDKEDDVHMWSAMKEFRDSGVQEGRREGIIEGKLEGQTEARLDSIKTIMRKLNQTVDEAMDTLDIEEKDRAKYRELINS